MPIALVLLGAFFVVTGFAARLYHRTHQSLARQWYQHGEAELRVNRPAAAVEDFRMALAYAPADEKIELLMLRAGDTPRAEREFLRAQWIDRRQKGAFAGAGDAAYLISDYRRAALYPERAIEEDPPDRASAQRLETSRLVLRVDPFEPRWGDAELTGRILRAWKQAMSRLETIFSRIGGYCLVFPSNLKNF